MTYTKISYDDLQRVLRAVGFSFKPNPSNPILGFRFVLRTPETEARAKARAHELERWVEVQRPTRQQAVDKPA